MSAGPDLFGHGHANPAIAEGAVLLGGFAEADAGAVLAAIASIERVAPFRRMVTPGGFTMSVEMTNCGEAGWFTDRSGYRYETADPASGRSWPAMPAIFADVAGRAAARAGYPGFRPDSCLVNRYRRPARLTLHQDRNERDRGQPIVSVSLGLGAVFLFGGLSRRERPRRIPLVHGDVVVWGGPARLAFHGVEAPEPGRHPMTGDCRINLTFRKAL
jgi:alkylated DNA repair protein (DNA oxidative demethylase)